MRMTWELANELMNALACVAISANGGAEVDEHGEARVSPENLELINTYARNKFVEICDEWEELMGEKWAIEEKSSNPTSPTCPNCGEELTLYNLPEVDCKEYECTKCGKSYAGKVIESSEPATEEA